MSVTKPLTVYDELDELKGTLRSAEIAEVIGRRPETISRIRRGRPVSRRTERALDALYVIVTSLLERFGGDAAATRFDLFRRRAELGGRSAADLIRSGEIDRVLELAIAVEAELLVSEELDALLRRMEYRGSPQAEPSGTREVERFLGEHPELRPTVALVAEAARSLFGADAELVLDVLSDVDSGAEELYAGIRSSLPVGVATERLRQLYRERWDGALDAVADRLTVGLDFS